MSEKLLISEGRDNNFEGKSNEELFKQALAEGLNRRFDKTLEEAKKLEQIEEMANFLINHTCMSDFQAEIASRMLYNADYRRVIMCKDCAYRDTENCSLTYWDGEALVSNVSGCDFCSGVKAKDSEEGRG